MLSDSLFWLLKRCETICVLDCCGRDALDLSPIHIASWLIMWTGEADSERTSHIREQAMRLKRKFGTESGKTERVTFGQINQIFTPQEVDAFADELLANLNVALEIIEIANAKRAK